MAYQNSTSWRVTRLVRMIGRQVPRIKRTLIFPAVLLSNLSELKRIIIKVVGIYGREGLSGVKQRLKLLQSDPYVLEYADYRGLSTSVLKQLKIVAHVLLPVEQL